ncbi:MAG TPA: L,D-transpeptidase family protein [Hyphomicrobiaceae bacterium]|nr:L,D-transpeptidase family protein [Hyphomicrobiaceae bacterium]
MPPPPPPLSPAFAERLAATGKLSAGDRVDREALAKFYEARRSEPVWVTANGFTLAANAAIAEIGRADDWGLQASAFSIPSLPPAAAAALPAEQRADAEIGLSLAILKYARYARGGRTEPLQLSRNLDRKPPLLDPLQVIQAAADSPQPDRYLRSLQPQHPQFEALRQKYLEIKRGEPVTADASDEGGKGKKKRKSEALSREALLQKILVNMEEWRWMPPDLGTFYAWVNVPEFTLRVVNDGKVVESERVVVGKPNKQTPIFSDEIEQVIFHPFWGVPDSIKAEELLPSLARGRMSVLERNNLKVQYRGRNIDPESVDWSRADVRNFHIYQPPGGRNVLGVVKFRFPNKHDVYMHDTPEKNLFNASVRAFSHGCMRVRNPQKFAELLLGHDQGWTRERVAAAVRRGPDNNEINLARRIPVHITYFTAAVSSEGKLELFNDIYGHEKRIALGIEGKAYLIPHPKEEIAPRQLPPDDVPPLLSADRRGKNDWRRRVFENF